MAIYTTEIASDKIPSDNPVHQRLLKAYYLAVPYMKGDVLELGCGEGRGVELLALKAKSFLGLDKIEEVIARLREKFPEYQFESSTFPPVRLPDNSFDTIVSFQVIEHVKDDKLFLEEIYRILKPGGKAILTTPNILMTLTRNPWHVREYTSGQLKEMASAIFDHVEMKGVAGSERMMKYYEQNKESVRRIMRFDILDLQHRLPASILRVPYDILNRMNRNSLHKQEDQLASSISQEDFFLQEEGDTNLDLFCILEKKK